MLLPQPAAGVDCAKKPNHPQCGPGSEGQPVTPATITFCNDDPNCDPFDPFDPFGDEIESDGGAYVDGVPADPERPLQVFIGSGRNDGNIILRPKDSGRKLRINVNVPTTNTCGLPAGPFDYDFQTLRVYVNSEVSGGVFGLAPGELAMVPMRIRFFHEMDVFVLKFDPKGPGPCKNQSGQVRVERAAEADGGASWTVSDGGTACIEKHNTGAKNELCARDAEMNFSFLLEELLQ